MTTIEETLKERNGTHGNYVDQCLITVSIKRAFRHGRNWHNLSAYQQEAMDMTAVKYGRILSGDPKELDHWHDVVGYNKLVEEALGNEPKENS